MSWYISISGLRHYMPPTGTQFDLNASFSFQVRPPGLSCTCSSLLPVNRFRRHCIPRMHYTSVLPLCQCSSVTISLSAHACMYTFCLCIYIYIYMHTYKQISRHGDGHRCLDVDAHSSETQRLKPSQEINTIGWRPSVHCFRTSSTVIKRWSLRTISIES